MNALGCRKLECVFGGVRALKEVDLDVNDCEFVCIVGTNSAGKTTLLNFINGTINGSDSRRSGQVLLRGVDISALPLESRAKMGVIRSFENPRLWSDLSCLDNVALGVRNGGIRSRRELAMKSLAQVDAANLASTEGSKLSVGQKRIVELARIIARLNECGSKGALLLLDEPFRGLDSQARQKVVEILRNRVLGQVPVLMVEHEYELVRDLKPRFVYMDNGRIVSPPAVTSIAQDCPRCDPPTSYGAPVLQVHDVRAGYNGAEVLHGINLELHEGECVRLEGGNGAGKSTLIRVVLGALPVQSGRVSVRSVPVTSPPRFDNGMGYSPQEAESFCGRLTVADVLNLARERAARLRCSPDMGVRFLDRFPELLSIQSKVVSELSSGQRSLVFVAVAFSTEPTLLVLDEPTAGMSVEWSERVYGFIGDEWFGPHRAALIVEHKPWNFPARRVCLEKGRMI
jgi:ABC-type branched-subunit amino acid transport system ATPase component